MISDVSDKEIRIIHAYIAINEVAYVNVRASTLELVSSPHGSQHLLRKPLTLNIHTLLRYRVNIVVTVDLIYGKCLIVVTFVTNDIP